MDRSCSTAAGSTLRGVRLIWGDHSFVMTLANTGSGVLAMKVPANGRLSLAGSDFQLTLVGLDLGGLAGANG